MGYTGEEHCASMVLSPDLIPAGASTAVLGGTWGDGGPTGPKNGQPIGPGGADSPGAPGWVQLTLLFRQCRVPKFVATQSHFLGQKAQIFWSKVPIFFGRSL